MSELDDLLAACVASPDDDAPRLVWADAVGGERGELVVIQCRLAQNDLPPAEAGALIGRLDELLAAHGKEWSGFADVPAVKRCMFRRGFVEAVEADVVAMPWTSIFDRAPLVSALELEGISQLIDYSQSTERIGTDPIGFLAEMFARPELQRLHAIGIDGAYLYESMGGDEWDNDVTSRADQVLELIASSGKLRGMRALTIHDTFTERGIHELLSSNVLGSIERLAFEMGSIERSQARELMASMPNLRALDLGSALKLHDIADVIPASVVEFRGGAPEKHMESLFTMSVAPTLERLRPGGYIGPHLASFGVFQRLRSLDVRNTAIAGPRQGDPENRAVSTFAGVPLPALREFHLFADLTAEDGLRIAEAFGGQLACLDLTGASGADSPALRERVAGYVRTGPMDRSETFLHAGTNTREPWLRYGLVTLQR